MSKAKCKGGRMTGGRALAEMLHVCGVGPLFGMGGFQMLPFYEGIRALGMEHYLITDENNGALSADAYARMTGRPAVCDGTTGPGAANLATGLIESLNAGVPVIAVVGDTHRAHSWKNMTQEARQMELLRPCVKELIRVEVTARVPELVRRAFAVATSGRPGPVLLDLPEDVMHGDYEFAPEDFYVNERILSAPSLRSRPAACSVEAAAEMLAKAKRPMILAGGGVHLSWAQETLNAFAKEFAIPVAYTMSGKGVVADTDEISVGLFGRYSRIANDLMDKADCLFVVGCKLGEIASKRYELPKSGMPLIHLDIVPEEIDRWARTTVGMWGDAKESLLDLAPVLRAKLSGRVSRPEYFKEIKKRKDDWYEIARVRYESDESPVNMGRMMAELNKFMPEDGVLIVDGGFAAHWGALLYDTKKAGRTFVANRGFASIGYGLPAGIGVSLAARHGGLKGPVVSITGDCGLNMSIGELDTAMRAKTAFILIVVNNAASGYVRSLQHAFYGEGHYQSSAITDTDFAAVARSYGCYGIRVEKPGDLQAALKKAAKNKDKPTIVDVVVTRDPGQMLPAADNRALAFRAGDRPV
ncbi:acetolactate synthase [Deltaproteobacteria bacterium]|nr:acetolactate synthase [Deltaproteobacteria bacterium]GHV53322.1 acetolactate synthase [Deltaproteobacteria bacterium]